MKILIISTVIWNFYQGRQHQLALGFVKREHRVTFLEPLRYIARTEDTSNRLKDLVQNPIPSNLAVVQRRSRLQKGIFFMFVENIRNVWYVFRHRPEVIISSDIFSSLLLVLFCRLLGIRFVFDYIDNWEDFTSVTKIQKFIIRYISVPLLCRVSHFTTSTSHKLHERARQYSRYSMYIPNGIDIEEIQSFLLKDQWETPRKKIIYVGSMRGEYDFDPIFYAADCFPEIQFELYGNGNSFQYVQQQARGKKNISVHPSVSQKEMYRLLQESFIGIIPIRDDFALPLKTLTYWALQIPIICSPTYELTQVAKDAALFASTKEEWVAQISELLKNEKLRQRLIHKGRSLVEQTYDYKILIKTFESKVLQ